MESTFAFLVEDSSELSDLFFLAIFDTVLMLNVTDYYSSDAVNYKMHSMKEQMGISYCVFYVCCIEMSLNGPE